MAESDPSNQVAPIDPIQQRQEEELRRRQEIMGYLMRLERQWHAGANTFYWIAALSVINTIAYVTGADFSFMIGLGFTQVITGLAVGMAEGVSGDAVMIIKAVGIVLSLAVAGLFVGAGILANRRHKWSFIAGMVLYGLDGLIFLLFKDYFPLIFHLVMLFYVFAGFSALNKLNKITQPKQPQTAVPVIR
jgi:hypothetical protein